MKQAKRPMRRTGVYVPSGRTRKLGRDESGALLRRIRAACAARFWIDAREVGWGVRGGDGRQAGKVLVLVARKFGVRAGAIAQFMGRVPAWVNSTVSGLDEELVAIAQEVEKGVSSFEVQVSSGMSEREKSYREFREGISHKEHEDTKEHEEEAAA